MKRIFGIGFIFLISSTNIFAQQNESITTGADNTYYTDNNSNTSQQPGDVVYNNQNDNNAAVYNNGDNQNNAAVNPDNKPAPTYQSFHDQLSPYGNWINIPGYGNVWQPVQASNNFSPYATDGHWVYTEFGWTWVSDYAWGSATFHYGRWFRDASYGWLWEPGYAWAPAWVAWGNYGGYYCWAPLAPGYGFGNYRPAFAAWNFIPRAYIGCARPYNYMVDRGRIFNGGVARISLINEAGNFHNSRFFAGPRAEEVEHYSNQHINRVSMAAVNHATTQHFNNQGQANRQNSINHAPASNYNQSTVPVNRNMANNYQPNRGMQQANHYNANVQQHYATQQNMQAQRSNSYNSQQPVQRNTEHNFASAQSRSAGQYSQRGGNNYHASGGRMSSGGSHGGGGGHSRR